MKLNNPDKVYAGSQEVDRIYAGPNLVWENITIPEAPFVSSITAVNGTTVSVVFNQGFDGGATISDYEFSLNGGAFQSSGQTSSPLTISGLSLGTTFNIRIRAVNEAGPSNPSNEESVTTFNLPSAPNLTSAETQRFDRILINWNAPSNDGGTGITGYQFSTNNGGSWTNTNSTSTSRTISGLSAGVTYIIRVRAVNSVGAGNQSNSRSDTTFRASGGNITRSGGFVFHRFTSSGNFRKRQSGNLSVNIELVGGGGGGGSSSNVFGGNGGGGAGGRRTRNTTITTTSNLAIAIGGGGSPSTNGNNTSGISRTATGGGSGGNFNGGAGSGGGCGGGGAGNSSSTKPAGGTGSQGGDGGKGHQNISPPGASTRTGGGGGGTTQNGDDAGTTFDSANRPNPGRGGNGHTIFGIWSVGGGGGGGQAKSGGRASGGSGGGGRGGQSNRDPENGTNNTGGGGGGAGSNSTNGGNGGSGVYVIRYSI